ncbi:hypothetical protein G6F63_016270 [Rhizopus arrhizus]|nr:hypothetical protein G6F63_016270 [Rhizopus arrhizus]
MAASGYVAAWRWLWIAVGRRTGAPDAGRGHCQCAGGAGREEMDAIDANLAALGAHLRTQAASSPTGAAVR